MSREAGHTASKKRAPEPLDLVQRFVNTRNRLRDYDLLGDVGEAARWLSDEGFSLDEGISIEELQRILALREAIRAILAAHTLGASGDSNRAAVELDKICETSRMRASFAPEGRPQLLTASGAVEGFVEALLVAAIQAQHAGIWRRLKACANEDCRWVFYDKSKNHSGNWCVMEICGSRAKMHTYRQRRASQQIH